MDWLHRLCAPAGKPVGAFSLRGARHSPIRLASSGGRQSPGLQERSQRAVVIPCMLKLPSSVQDSRNVIGEGRRHEGQGTMRIPRITPAVARKLGHYVYLYVNPIDESIFYVGKGKGGRALAHLRADERQEVTKTIREIQAGGQERRIEILADGLRTEDAALRVESATIARSSDQVASDL